MRDGFVKVAAGTPKIKVADCVSNREAIYALIKDMAARKAKIMVFPELCLTGYDCRDLFWQETLIRSAEENLLALADETADIDALIFVGLPIEKDGKLYNVRSTAAISSALCRNPICRIIRSFTRPATSSRAQTILTISRSQAAGSPSGRH